MENLELRLNIFLNSSIINQEEYEVLKYWIELIHSNCKNYELEKLERMITHSAMMMKRTRDHEELELLNEEVFNSIKENDNYEKSLVLFNKMNEAYPMKESEKRYMIIHLCALLNSEVE